MDAGLDEQYIVSPAQLEVMCRMQKSTIKNDKGYERRKLKDRQAKAVAEASKPEVIDLVAEDEETISVGTPIQGAWCH